MTAHRERQRSHGLAHYLVLGLSAGMLAVVVGLAVAVIGLPAIVGGTALTVLTQSMEPKLPPGTLVVVRPVATDAIRIGDVLTYQIASGKPEVVSHRVIAIARSTSGETTFTTQGDNNDAPDANPVTVAQVKGTVWYSVPWIGYLNTLVGGADKGWLVPVIAVALFLYAGWMFASGIASRRRRTRRASGRRNRHALGLDPTD